MEPNCIGCRGNPLTPDIFLVGFLATKVLTRVLQKAGTLLNRLRPQVYFCGVYFNWFWCCFIEAAEMFQVHRVRSVDWKPTSVVALATSVDQSQVAVAREDASIEIWNAAPGSVGWHCELAIPGRDGSVISSLVWCQSISSSCSSGRLFSAGLDGSISEWDLGSLQQKTVVEGIGGSIWQMAVEPLQRVRDPRIESSRHNDDGGDDDDENGINSTASGSDSEEEELVVQRVAIGCDDGAVRIYVVRDSEEGMEYYRSFPRVKGKILSVVWSLDAKKIFAGGSDGCIRCWDLSTMHEVYRITAGIGGLKTKADICIWSLLVLRDGTLVSGDSTGSTQFWDAHQGTLLQALTYHKGDVFALAATPSHQGVFSAGSDSQVVCYKFVPESTESVKNTVEDFADCAGNRWVFVGSNRVHTHDVRALTVATPQISEQGELLGAPSRKKHSYRKPPGMDYQKWAVPGVPMLISGGDDTKLFAYPANTFLDFYPHDICPAPQRLFVQLACGPEIKGGPMMLIQYSSWLDVSMINVGMDNEFKAKTMDIKLGKRKGRFEFPEKKEKHLVRGNSSKLLARLKCKASQRIICSAISESGNLIAFSDRIKPRLFEMKIKLSTESEGDKGGWKIKKKVLPQNLLPAHSMVFSADSTRLLIACYDRKIHVVDVENIELLHIFDPFTIDRRGQAMSRPPITRLYASGDGQWLAAINCCGDIDIFNLEVLRQHWHISRLDGAGVTAAGFHPSNKNVLVVTTSSNHVYALDVDAKQLGEWSKRFTFGLPKHFLEFPGGIVGLSFPPSAKATSVIVYSTSAMCLIDFGKPVKHDENNLMNGGALALDTLDHSKHALANGKRKKPNHKAKLTDNNFAIVPFSDPVLFLAHLSEHSILVVEKPWVDVLQNFRAPVYRHLYGT